MKVTIYNDVLSAITKLLNKSFKTIALDTNQLEDTEGLQNLQPPALFISLGEIQWEVDTHYYFTDETDITLTIACQSVGDSIYTYLETVTDALVDKFLTDQNDVTICQNLTLKHTTAPEDVDGLTTMDIVFATTLRQKRFADPNTVKVTYVTDSVKIER